ncbi:MAG TPA: hypothetical protein VKZ79_19335 [Alphaproteobacteria bacterium]|nr:hypothetical protein [Alphaproteobacteria bacterium]
MKAELEFAVALAFALACASPAHAAGTGTLGLAIVSWNTALYETPDGKEECPDGLALSTEAVYFQSLPPDERARWDKATKGGTVDLDEKDDPISDLRRRALERGPHGEDVCWNPTVVKDPPLRTVQGSKSFGLNLDGTSDGHATANSCAHQKFTAPDGTPAIDNQWYRLIGCSYGWRSSGYVESNVNGELKDSGHAILIEISGIDDPRNSPDVEVAFYRSLDLLPKDSAGNILPFMSYRAYPNYRYVTHGKIEGGVLTTDPIDARFPFFGNLTHAEHFIHGMRLRLKIAPDGRGASGLVAGYYDLDTWWNYLSKLGYVSVAGRFDCPALWVAAHQLADGYPDPKTGQCTALSSAFRIEAVTAFVVRPGQTAAR